MVNNLRVSIRDNNPKREKIILELFDKVKHIIETKREFLYGLQIESYEFLKSKFEGDANKKCISDFEKNNRPKAVCLPENKIILFNNLFFDCLEINQKSVFIHEIGHIINQLPLQAKDIEEENLIVERVYKEYLADLFLFEIDKDIFLNGRIIPYLNELSLNKLKNNIETSNDKDNVIKGKFINIGMLYYLYFLYKYRPLLLKIDELINLVKESANFICKSTGITFNLLNKTPYTFPIVSFEVLILPIKFNAYCSIFVGVFASLNRRSC